MAIGLLAALFAGQTIKNSMDQRQRDKLQAGINKQFGFGLDAAQTPGIPGATGGQPQFNPDGSIGVQPGQGGLFPQAGIPPNPGQLFQGGSQLFGLPGGAELGTNLMRDALAFQQQNQQQLARFDQQLVEQKNRFGQRDTEQLSQNEFTAGQAETLATADLEEQRLNRDSRELIARNRLRVDAAAGGVKAPAGYSVFQDPRTGQQYLAAAPGSKPYQDAQHEIATSERAITEIDTVIESMKTQGTSVVGEESGRQGIRYRNIVAAIASLQNLGVLQEAEAQRLEDSIQDPSSIMGGISSLDTTTIAAYEELQKLFQNKLGEANQKYSLWGLGSQMQSATPAQQRDLERVATANASASVLGITIDQLPVARGTGEQEAFGGLFPRSSQAPQVNFGASP